MKLLFRMAMVFGLILIFIPTAYGTTITYDATHLVGNQWEYSFSVTNDTLNTVFEEFTVFFDLGVYDNLTISATPPTWDPIAINPDPNIPDDGFYDALSLNFGIAPDETLPDFNVQFDYLGTGRPGSQYFEVVDASYNVLDSGYTTPAAAPVPEPSSIILFFTGILGFFSFRRKKLN